MTVVKCPKCVQKISFPEQYSGDLICFACEYKFHTRTIKSIYPNPKSKTGKKNINSNKQKIREYKEKNIHSSPHKMNFETMLSYGIENLKSEILAILLPIPIFIFAGILMNMGLGELGIVLGFLLYVSGILVFLIVILGITTKVIADAVSYSIHVNSKEK